MTNKEILSVYKGLAELSEAKIRLNIKVSYTLARNKILLEKYVKIIEEHQRNIYIKYGTSAEDGSIKVPYEFISKLNTELSELMEIENNVELTKINIEDLGTENIELSIIENLMPLIKTQE